MFFRMFCEPVCCVTCLHPSSLFGLRLAELRHYKSMSTKEGYYSSDVRFLKGKGKGSQQKLSLLFHVILLAWLSASVCSVQAVTVGVGRASHPHLQDD